LVPSATDAVQLHDHFQSPAPLEASIEDSAPSKMGGLDREFQGTLNIAGEEKSTTGNCELLEQKTHGRLIAKRRISGFAPPIFYFKKSQHGAPCTSQERSDSIWVPYSNL